MEQFLYGKQPFLKWNCFDIEMLLNKVFKIELFD